MTNFLKYFFTGIFFGIVLIKAEVISWYRIQEMFHFQSFHMYGIIGSAVLVGTLSVFIMRKLDARSLEGDVIDPQPKPPQYKAHLFGGIVFGLGWALTGACPAPIYALIGAGLWPYMVVLISAILGTFAYGYIQDKLPH
ncbi:MAG: DUF6691 family protein [Flavobacteriales bacterium]